MSRGQFPVGVHQTQPNDPTFSSGVLAAADFTVNVEAIDGSPTNPLVAFTVTASAQPGTSRRPLT
ncbi:MAG: hypothetical protein ABSB24_02265 [Gaiellaceae bacterium]|jgi:hypothetical protein